MTDTAHEQPWGRSHFSKQPYCRFCCESEIIVPMSFVQVGDWAPYDGAGRRKYIDAGERVRFLAEADQLPPKWRTLCYVYAFTGCRVSEALELGIHRLDAERGRLLVRTLKRRKLVFRAIPIPDFLVAMLLELSCDEQGRWWPHSRVTAWRWVKVPMTHAQIRGPQATGRGLRHGFGIKAAQRSVPPSLMQRWMGHATLEMSFTYVDAVGVEESDFAARMWNLNSDSARSTSSTRNRSDLPASGRSARRASYRSPA